MYIQNVGFDEINYLEIALRMDILAWPKCNFLSRKASQPHLAWRHRDHYLFLYRVHACA